MVAEQLDGHMQGKWNPICTLHPIQKLTQVGHNKKPKTIWLLIENMGENLCDLGMGKDTTSETHSIFFFKVDKLDFIKA